MSRAFVKEDSGDYVPPGRFGLPPRDDPRFDAAAAEALIEAARDANTAAAEAATGYRWGEDRLHPHVRRILDRELALPEHEQNLRVIRVARRFLGER
jgi:plasmid stabilization system protein ParE